MKSICVFCGSSAGNRPIFEEQARALGHYLALNNINLVYGGAKIGLMGAVADAVLNNGGTVTGVIPDFLAAKEIVHDDLTELMVVETMHQRKMIMHEHSDAIIALPGGFGTMEELFEVLTWAQLGLHQKPIGILNVDGYYDALLTLIADMRAASLLKPIHHDLLLADNDIVGLIDKMNNFKGIPLPHWMKDKTDI